MQADDCLSPAPPDALDCDGVDDGYRRPIDAMRDELVEQYTFTPQRCRLCGCTDMLACDPPCAWVDADTCTGCVGDNDRQVVMVGSSDSFYARLARAVYRNTPDDCQGSAAW